MDDEIETLLIDVRASTSGFRADIETMRGAIDTTLIDGFAQAGNVLESGILSAIRRGSLGFDDLKRSALRAMNEIAAQAVQSGIGSLFGGPQGSSSNSGLSAALTTAVGAIFGLPGRATGGPVGPGSAYLVGERGPEVFVPTSSGRVVTSPAGASRAVHVSINLAQPKGSDAPVAMRRSARQIASSVRRALQG